MRVRFPYDYSSHVGTWAKGEVADVDDALGAWLLRDAGAEEVTETDAQPRQQAKPKNRQVTKPRNDRGKGETMNTTNTKLTKGT